MMLHRKMKRWLIGLATAAVPLVTAASCDPYSGFSFFRDDDNGYGGSCYFDCYADPYYYVDPYYYDDCYYDDCYYGGGFYYYEKRR